MVDPGEGLRGTSFDGDPRGSEVALLLCPRVADGIGSGRSREAQFGVQAQYLIGRFPSATLLVCLGAAGSLDADLSVGDVVVGTETVEHDYRLLFATRPMPRFPGDAASLAVLRRAANHRLGFRVGFDIIASGDEDIVTSARAAQIRAQTGAVCVAGRVAARRGLRPLTALAILKFAGSPMLPTRKRHKISPATCRSRSGMLFG